MATTPLDIGDTVYYVDEILSYIRQPDLAAQFRFLDFGHLVWRPAGWAFLQLATALHKGPLPHPDLLIVRFFVTLSMISGAATTLFMCSLCRRLGMRPIVTLVTCATLAASNAVLNTSQSGSSYATGLMLLTAAVWTLIRPTSNATQLRLWIAGGLFGLSICCWFPFILGGAAVLAVAAIDWQRAMDRPFSPRVRLGRTVQVLVATAFVVLAIYGTAAVFLRISTVHGGVAWFKSTEHGLRQSQNVLRIGMGLPRCCLAFGEDGVLWKRFLFKDIYAHVTVMDLVQASLAKLALFYAGLLLVGVRLLRSEMGRMLLAVTLAAAIPVTVFAIFLYEPSSIERFLPVFPFAFLAFAYQLSDVWPSRFWRIATVVFSAMVITINVAAHLNSRIETKWAPTIERIQTIQREADPGSNVAIIGYPDQIHYFLKDNPLNPARPDNLRYWFILHLANDRIFKWREEFAGRVENAWLQSSQVWISKRVLAPEPVPDWGWVEGDDAAVRWRELPEFFGRFEFDRKIGGQDGFVRLAQSAGNRTAIERLLHH